MKTNEELNALKEEVETVSRKLHELTANRSWFLTEVPVLYAAMGRLPLLWTA